MEPGEFGYLSSTYTPSSVRTSSIAFFDPSEVKTNDTIPSSLNPRSVAQNLAWPTIQTASQGGAAGLRRLNASSLPCSVQASNKKLLSALSTCSQATRIARQHLFLSPNLRPCKFDLASTQPFPGRQPKRLALSNKALRAVMLSLCSLGPSLTATAPTTSSCPSVCLFSVSSCYRLLPDTNASERRPDCTRKHALIMAQVCDADAVRPPRRGMANTGYEGRITATSKLVRPCCDVHVNHADLALCGLSMYNVNNMRCPRGMDRQIDR
jgi:hypothetical protein